MYTASWAVTFKALRQISATAVEVTIGAMIDAQTLKMVRDVVKYCRVVQGVVGTNWRKEPVLYISLFLRIDSLRIVLQSEGLSSTTVQY